MNLGILCLFSITQTVTTLRASPEGLSSDPSTTYFRPYCVSSTTATSWERINSLRRCSNSIHFSAEYPNLPKKAALKRPTGCVEERTYPRILSLSMMALSALGSLAKPYPRMGCAMRQLGCHYRMANGVTQAQGPPEASPLTRLRLCSTIPRNTMYEIPRVEHSVR